MYHYVPFDLTASFSGLIGLISSAQAWDYDEGKWVNKGEGRFGWVSEGEYKIQEAAGACYLMTGESRHEWHHGCEEFGGKRLSVTWRWFREEVMKAGKVPVKFRNNYNEWSYVDTASESTAA